MTDTKTADAPPAKTIDLSSLDIIAAADKGFELELLHPATKAPLGVFVSLVGKDSTVFREHIRRNGNDRLRKQALQQRRGKDVDVPTYEKIEAEAIELLAVCTTGWRNVEYRGVTLPFSQVNAAVIYRDLPWIREQVDEAIGDIENFMPG
jgi:hypothetical protein